MKKEELEKYLQEFEKDIELKKLDDISTLEIKFWQCEDRDEDLAQKFGKTLVQLLLKSNNIDLIKKIVTSLKKLYQDYLKNENIARSYASGLFNLLNAQEDLDLKSRTISQLGKLHSSFSTSEGIGLAYAKGLFNLSENQLDLYSLKGTISQLEKLHISFPKREEIGFEYAKGLVNLSAKQSDLDSIKGTISQLGKLHASFSTSEGIGLAYAKGLFNLSNAQSDLDLKSRTISQLGKLHASFSTSEAIGSVYASGLVNLSANQSDLNLKSRTISQLEKLHTSFSNSKNIVIYYIMGLWNIVNFLNHEKKLLELAEKLRILIELFENHSEVIPLIIKNKLFDFFLSLDISNDKDKLIKGIVNVINLVFGQAVNGLNSYSLSIYNDFNELKEEETQKDFILLLKLIYNIKQILLVDTDKETKKAFGHYTSLQALGFMLAMDEVEQDGQKQKLKNSETYSRLSHVLHMNDPKEGKMLDEYLEISDNDFKESNDDFKKSNDDLTSSVTPWFLMSLTTNLDNLAMWSQYGDNAKGVCIAFKKESFKLEKPANFSDLSFKSYKSTLQKDENDADCSKFEIKEFDDEKDYLYKVAYITTKGSQSAIKILETDLIEKKDADNISKSLEDIKKIFDNIEENNKVIKIFSKHLDEVRYLFKSADYAYESELRLLKYVDFSDREKIKLNATKDSLPKLYVQRKSPIALNKIIFGPKLVEVEDLLPYIYLYDKNIKCTRSSIDFR